MNEILYFVKTEEFPRENRSKENIVVRIARGERLLTISIFL
ncbi:hypothetical protein [Halobacteriovorax sp. JY17]|nr:hypothetical protein [Halobacteriovorax sp. JY17]